METKNNQKKFELRRGEINDVIAHNVNNILNKLENNEIFKAEIPDMTPKEYLSQYSKISLKRLERILTIGAKRRISLGELAKIATVLQVRIEYLVYYDDEVLLELRKNK